MNIINELASSTIESNKKDGFATKISIFLAVVLLGTIVFIIGTLKVGQHQQIVSTIGDYHVSITDLNKDMLEDLFDNEDIKKISFDKYISTDLNALIIEKGTYFKDIKGFEITNGRDITSSNELIAPTRFFEKNEKYKIGSKLEVKGKEYTLVGEYRDYENTFEESALIGLLEDENKDTILDSSNGLEAFIWYKNPRDTYTQTKTILNDFQIDYNKALDTGRLFFNTPILKYQMIYPSGIIPPKSVIAEWAESYGALMVLVLLFAVMIYGAFNVWNNRDIKEFALLKSIGMTEKQVKKIVKIKAMKIGLLPVLAGTLVSYLSSNLLLYLMWLNNAISYENISNIMGEHMKQADFHLAPLSIPLILLIIFLSFLTVYLSAIVPAKKSAKLNIIEGLREVTDKKVKHGKSKISTNIEGSLAKDYFKAYNSTYKTIILAMLLSAMAMTLVLVSQSYRAVNVIYAKHEDPYNFQSKIFTDRTLSGPLIDDLYKVDGIDEIHLYQDKSFKFYFQDNEHFASDALKNAFESGNKNKEDMFVNVIALTEEDFNDLVETNKLSAETNYILLNKTPDKDNTPHSFREYIKLTNGDEKDIVVRYNAEGKEMPIHIDGYVREFPFDLEAQSQKGIYVFTRMTSIEKFIEQYGQDPGDPTNYYNVKVRADKDLDKVSDDCERVISSYIHKNDHFTTNDILKEASSKEQLRNEHMLNFGIQMILIMIALSNAYNSFHGNLMVRKRDFQLLSTAGMTDKQIKKMIFGEGAILLSKTTIAYVFVFFIAVALRAYRSNYEFTFAVKEILLRINYLPILLIFIIMAIGILMAIKSGLSSLQKENLNTVLREV